MGKLIVLEGTDGSGKSTQLALLCKRLETTGRDYRQLIFPRYAEPSSTLLRMYLAGEFGDNPEDVNAFAASTFYAVDRFASYKKDWGNYYQSGGLLLADRYTTSNAVHQGSKVKPEEREDFFQWLYDFEFRLMELPRPDLVIYLNMPTEQALELLHQRQAKTGGSGDIHERDAVYLKKCGETALAAARYYGWAEIGCAAGGDIREALDIHDEIYSLVCGILN